MADFSLTALFVVPVGDSLPISGSTEDLVAGQVGFFRKDYSIANAGNITAQPYFYVAQGRENNYLQSSKRSDKIASNGSNVTDWRKVEGCGTPAVEIWQVNNWDVKCGDVVTLTIRAHSSYIDTVAYNGLTRSVTVQAPCCDCGADPCTTVDVPILIDKFIEKLESGNPDGVNGSINLRDFFNFTRIGVGADSILQIEGKPLTKYAQPCDIAAFPHEYDRMWFRVFVYSGPDTTADFIVPDNCDPVANAQVTQRSTYAQGTSDEIRQLEKNYHSYMVAYLKDQFRMDGYNANFESWVTDGTIYDTFYIRFNSFEKNIYSWSDYITLDGTVIIACPQANTAAIEAVLEAALGPVAADNACVTTTSTTTTTFATTSTTTTLIP